jgi:hypothetical protein
MIQAQIFIGGVTVIMSNTEEEAILGHLSRLKKIAACVAAKYQKGPIMCSKLVESNKVKPVYRNKGIAYIPVKKRVPCVKERPTQHDILKNATYVPHIKFTIKTDKYGGSTETYALKRK